MRELFDELRRDGSDAIHRWIGEKNLETAQLDFKTKIRPAHGKLHKGRPSCSGASVERVR